MKGSFHLLFVISCIFQTSFAQKSSLTPYINQQGQNYLASQGAVGLSLGIVSNGKMSSYHFGSISKEKKELPTAETRYEIGSNTKVFASTLLAYAVIEHKMDLNDDIRKYLPGSYPNLEFQGKPIRLVHLANLSSGLPNWLPDNAALFQTIKPDSIPFALIAQHQDYNKQKFYQDLHEVVLATAPGDHPRHSNVAAQLLGFLLEEVYHQSFDSLVKRYITSPLSMKQTGFYPVDSAELATGYNDKGIRMPYLDLQDLKASSGLTSTTSDMLKFVDFQLKEQQKSVRLTQEITINSPQDTVGLNWHISTDGPGKRCLWHTGGTFGFSSLIMLYPDQQIGLVLMVNESGAATQTKLSTLANKIKDRIVQEKKRTKKGIPQ